MSPKLRTSALPLRTAGRSTVAALIGLLMVGPVSAFDPAQATPGLYYVGTNLREQLWTPLVLVRDGALVDPVDEVARHGLAGLQGAGKTHLLKAVSFFLYGGCGTETQLAQATPLFGGAPTIYVAKFDVRACAAYHASLKDKWTDPTSADVDDSMPRLQLSPPFANLPSGPIWGVQGALVKSNRQVAREPLTSDSGREAVVNGVVRSTWYVPLPVIQPDARALAAEQGRKAPASRHSTLTEIVHRKEIAVDQHVVDEAAKRIEPLMRERYLARLDELSKPFGGVLRSSFSMQVTLGVDIDGNRSDDLVGVSRLQVESRDGLSRWIDAAWSLRASGKSAPRLDIVRTTADDAPAVDQRDRPAAHPAPTSPTLVIAGLLDLDNDGSLELVTVQDVPVGEVVIHDRTEVGTSIAVSRQDAVIHSWSSDEGRWIEIFHGAQHEARTVSIPFKNISKISYDQ